MGPFFDLSMVLGLLSQLQLFRQLYLIKSGATQAVALNIQLMLKYLKGHSYDLPDNDICNISIYADDTTLYSKCDQASDLWQQLKLASELKSDLWNIIDWGRKWLDLNAGKTQLVSFDQSNNIGDIYVKMDGSVLEEKSSFKMLAGPNLQSWS